MLFKGLMCFGCQSWYAAGRGTCAGGSNGCSPFHAPKANAKKSTGLRHNDPSCLITHFLTLEHSPRTAEPLRCFWKVASREVVALAGCDNTFCSPSLSSSPRFTPDHIECWAVEILKSTKAGDQAALKGTVLERFKEDRAVLNMMGIADHASAAGEG